MRAASAGCAFQFSQHLSTRRRTQCAECCTHGMHMHGRGHAQTPRRAQSVPTEHGNGDARAACIRKRSTECATVREPRGRSGVCAGRQLDVRARLHGRPAWRSEGRRMRPLRWRWRLVREYRVVRCGCAQSCCRVLHCMIGLHRSRPLGLALTGDAVSCSLASYRAGLRRRPAPSACAVGLQVRAARTPLKVSPCAQVYRGSDGGMGRQARHIRR